VEQEDFEVGFLAGFFRWIYSQKTHWFFKVSAPVSQACPRSAMGSGLGRLSRRQGAPNIWIDRMNVARSLFTENHVTLENKKKTMSRSVWWGVNTPNFFSFSRSSTDEPAGGFYDVPRDRLLVGWRGTSGYPLVILHCTGCLDLYPSPVLMLYQQNPDQQNWETVM